MFKKLFTINYNNKTFLILVDTNHRRTFLEVLANGKYSYPTIEDFDFLNKMYNKKDPLISYVKKYNYDEKVKYKNKTIDLQTAISLGILVISPFVLVPQAKALSRNYSESQVYYSSKFEHEITKADVIKAINSNENLGERERTIALKVLDDMLKLDPDMNLRVFYENIGSLRIEYVSHDSLYDETHQHIAGYYDSRNNYIRAVDDADDFVIAHEIVHCSHSLVRRVGIDYVIICDLEGDFLKEAMTNKIAGISYSYNYSYYLEGLILDYFIYNTDKFDYHIYNEYGVTALIDELKEKYKDVDIDYIIDFFQTSTDTAINLGNYNMVLSNEDDILNELFKIAIANINTNDLFESFREFMKLTDNNENVRKKYFELYIEALKLQGYINENSIHIIKNIDHLVLINNNVYLSSDNKYLDYDGTEKELEGSYILIPTDNDFKEDLIIGISNNRDVYSKKFVHDMFLSNVLYDRNIAGFIANLPEEQQQILLDKMFDMIINETDDYTELTWLYRTFESIFFRNGDLKNKYWIKYKNKFDCVIADKGNFTLEELELIRSIKSIVEKDGVYYFSTNEVDSIFTYKKYRYLDSKFAKTIIASPYKVNIECVGADGKFMLETNKQVFNTYWFTDDEHDKMIEYFYNIKSSEKLTKENIEGYMELSNIRELSKYPNAFTLVNGMNVYNEKLSDNVILLIGKDKDGEFAYKIVNEDKTIYEKGIIIGNYVSLPYEEYLDGCNIVTNSFLDEFLSQENIEITLIDLTPVLPAVVSNYEQSDDGVLKPNINFINPTRIVIDGEEDYTRKVYILLDIDGKVYVNFPNNTKIEVSEGLSIDISMKYVYSGICFETCLSYFDIQPNSNNKYNFTKEQILKIVTDYVNSALIKEEENIK